ncbi:PqiC family protein [Ewingella americana]
MNRTGPRHPAVKLGLAALLLSGCASSPVHYYTLVPAGDDAVALTGQAPYVIDVQPVSIPGPLNQPQLMLRHGESEMIIAEEALWASPLDQELRAALIFQLEHKLNTTNVVSYRLSAGKPVIKINATFEQFDGWLGQKARIAVTWQLNFTDGRPQQVCHTRAVQASAGGYPALIATQQALLRRLSGEIATAIGQGHCGRGSLVNVQTQAGRFPPP